MKKPFEKTLAAFAASALFFTTISPAFAQEPASPPEEPPVIDESKAPVQEAESPADDTAEIEAIVNNLNTLEDLLNELKSVEDPASLIDLDNPDDIQALADFLDSVDELEAIMYALDCMENMENMDDMEFMDDMDDECVMVIFPDDMDFMDCLDDLFDDVFEEFFDEADMDCMDWTFGSFDWTTDWTPALSVVW